MGYVYKSLITDGELVQGDSSDINLFSTDMAVDLSVGGWEAKYTIRASFDTVALVDRSLPLNMEVIQDIPVNGCFVHQILPTESALLTAGQKYIVSIQIKNANIGYSGEVAQFKLKVLPQGVQ